MNDKKTPASAKTGKARFALADALWVTSFTASWGLLIALWNTWWALLLLPLFVGHLSGLSEFVHQTVHANLFARSRGWNRSLGKIAAALLSIDFDTYRTFHLDHHRFANTVNDPERPFYKAPAYLEMVAGWPELSARQKLGRIRGILAYSAVALASFGGDKPFVRAVRWAVPIAIVAIGFVAGTSWYLLPVQVFVAWYLPMFLLLPIDVLFAQSEHYRTEEIADQGLRRIVSLDEQYARSWNLAFPAPIEFLLIKRNLHAEHHLVPAIHWTQARDRGEGRLLRVRDYLALVWKVGPRGT